MGLLCEGTQGLALDATFAVKCKSWMSKLPIHPYDIAAQRWHKPIFIFFPLHYQLQLTQWLSSTDVDFNSAQFCPLIPWIWPYSAWSKYIHQHLAPILIQRVEEDRKQKAIPSTRDYPEVVRINSTHSSLHKFILKTKITKARQAEKQLSNMCSEGSWEL